MPSRYSELMQDIITTMFEGFVLDDDKKLQIVNEQAAKNTAEKIHKLVLEKSRDLWEQFESAEQSLRSAAAEINFEELNADVSNLGRGEADEVSIEDLTNMQGAQTLESKELKQVLGTDDFDLKSIFEGDDWFPTDDGDGGDRKLTDEGEGMPMMDAGDDEEELDGDKEFDQDMDDESDMVGDLGPEDALGEPEGDEIEIEPENGEDLGEPMDDLGGMDDELGLDDEEPLDGEEPMGDEGELGDFNFDDLLGDDEEDVEEMAGYRMESEGEDDDKDDDKDDKDDDKDDDDDKPAFLKGKDDD